MTAWGPHHDGSARYVSDLAPALGDTVTVFARTPAPAPRRVYVRTTPDGEPHFTAAVVDRVAGAETWWRADVAVRQPVTGYRWLLDDGPAGYRWLNALGVTGHDVPDAYDFRLVAYDPPPAWAADAVVYQIFPDRFARSPAADSRPVPEWAVPCGWSTPVVGRGPQTPYQLYGGDLDGITEHLDHVAGLGFTAVYLTPIFPARSNHRYDACAFDAVDPLLGGEAALGRLADAVHGRGMRLVGDLTTNHCGAGHPWFTAAAATASAPEREMFYFHPDGGYDSWLGVPSLPKLNWASAELRRRFTGGPDGVVARWLGVLDGWRVDVANMTGRLGGEDRALQVARLVRAAAVAARPDALVVAEHAHDASADLDADGWQGTMNYAGFTRPLWTWLRASQLSLPDFIGVPTPVPVRGGQSMVDTMRAFGSLVSWRARTHSWNLLGSHDTARIRTVVGDTARAEVATGLLMTMPGVPMVFAGDEYGLTGENGEGSRTPMPWGAPVLGYYRDLVGLRRAHPALRHGGLRWAYADDDAVAFVRETAGETLLVLARRAPGPPVRLPWPSPPGGVENRYGGAAAGVDAAGLTLPGDGPTLQVWRVTG
jgi:alpha-glucosidase